MATYIALAPLVVAHSPSKGEVQCYQGAPIPADATNLAQLLADGRIGLAPYIAPAPALPVTSDGLSLFVGGQTVAAPLIDSPGIFVPAKNPYSGLAWGATLLAKLQAGVLGVGASLGDSITTGCWSSSLRSKSWIALIGAALQAKWGDGGSGFWSTSNSPACLGAAGRNINATALASYVATGELYSHTGFVSGGGNVPGWYCVASTAIGDTLTGTTRGRYIDIITSATTGYTFTVDGGAVQTVTGLSGTANVMGQFTFDCGAGNTGNHTVVLTTTTTSSKVPGFRGRNTSGFILDRYSVYGAKMGDFNPAISGLSGGATSGVLLADHLFYALFVNDGANAIAGDVSMQGITGTMYNYFNSYQSSAKVGTANTALDVQLVLPHQGRGDTLATPGAGGLQSRLLTFARDRGFAVTDIGSFYRHSYDIAVNAGYFGDPANVGANGGSTDAVHPSDAGHAAMAAIASRPLQTAGLL